MKKLHFYLSLVTLLLAASCCDDKLCDGTLSNKEDAPSNLEQLEELLIDAHTISINAAQAECVSQLFMRRENSSAATRSTFASKEPKNSFSITKSDSVVAYVVNYEEGGFTIVSATKKYAPILAFSENGEITEADLDGNGLVFWKDCITADILKSEYQIQPNTAEYAEVKSQWRDYEKPTETMAVSTTHVPNNATDWYVKLRNQMMTEVGMCEERRQDFYYYAFSIFGIICDQATDEARYQENDRKLAITYANESYVPPCFVWGYGVSDLKSYKVGPFLKTYWDQGYPYNSYLPPHTVDRMCLHCSISNNELLSIPGCIRWCSN